MDDQEIVRIAKARSNEMLASTQAKADALRRASSQFCDEALRRTEEAVAEALSEIRNSRSKFRALVNPQAKNNSAIIEDV